MTGGSQGWLFWAALSAGFAALTAIFAKAGVDEIDPDLATFLRTAVVLAVLGTILVITRTFDGLSGITPRGAVFLVLSGLATGASWLCYFRALRLGNASQVAPVDKLSVVLVAVFGVLFLGEHLASTAWLGVGMIAGGAVLIALS